MGGYEPPGGAKLTRWRAKICNETNGTPQLGLEQMRSTSSGGGGMSGFIIRWSINKLLSQKVCSDVCARFVVYVVIKH